MQRVWGLLQKTRYILLLLIYCSIYGNEEGMQWTRKSLTCYSSWLDRYKKAYRSDKNHIANVQKESTKQNDAVTLYVSLLYILSIITAPCCSLNFNYFLCHIIIINEVHRPAKADCSIP